MKQDARSFEVVSSQDDALLRSVPPRRYLPAIVALGILFSFMALLIARHETSQNILRLQQELSRAQQKSHDNSVTQALVSVPRDGGDELPEHHTQREGSPAIVQVSHSMASSDVPGMLPELQSSNGSPAIASDIVAEEIDASEVACRMYAAKTTWALGDRLAKEGLQGLWVDSESSEDASDSSPQIALMMQAQSAWITSLGLRHDMPPEAWSMDEMYDYIEDAESILVLAEIISLYTGKATEPDPLLPVIDTILASSDFSTSLQLQWKLTDCISNLVQCELALCRPEATASVVRRIGRFAESQPLQSPQRKNAALLMKELMLDICRPSDLNMLPITDYTECYLQLAAGNEQGVEVFRHVIDFGIECLCLRYAESDPEETQQDCEALIRLLCDPRFANSGDREWKLKRQADLYVCLSDLSPMEIEKQAYRELAIGRLKQLTSLRPANVARDNARGGDPFGKIEEHSELGRLLSASGQHERAIEHFAVCFELMPTLVLETDQVPFDLDKDSLFLDAVPSLQALCDSGKPQLVRTFLTESTPNLAEASTKEKSYDSIRARTYYVEMLLKLGEHEKALQAILVIGEEHVGELRSGDDPCGHPLEVLDRSDTFLALSTDWMSRTRSADGLIPLLKKWSAEYEQVCRTPTRSLDEVAEGRSLHYLQVREVLALSRLLNECKEPELASVIARNTIEWGRASHVNSEVHLELYACLAESYSLLGDCKEAAYWCQRFFGDVGSSDHTFVLQTDDAEVVIAEYHLKMREQGLPWNEVVACHPTVPLGHWNKVAELLIGRREWTELDSLMAALDSHAEYRGETPFETAMTFRRLAEHLFSCSEDDPNPEAVRELARQYLDRSASKFRMFGFLPVSFVNKPPYWLKDRDSCLVLQQHLLECLGRELLRDRSDPRMALGIVQLHLGAGEDGERLLIESLSDYFQLENQQDLTPDLTRFLSVSEIGGRHDSRELVRAALSALTEHLKSTGNDAAMQRWTHIFEITLKEHYWHDVALQAFSLQDGDPYDLVTLKSLYELAGRVTGPQEIETLRQKVAETRAAFQKILDKQSLESIDLMIIQSQLAKSAGLSEEQRLMLRPHLPMAVAHYLLNAGSVNGRTLADICEILHRNRRDGATLVSALEDIAMDQIGRHSVSKHTNCIGGIKIEKLRSHSLVYASFYRGYIMRKFDGSPEYEFISDVLGQPSHFFCIRGSANVLAVCHDALVEILPDGHSELKFRFSAVPKDVAISDDGMQIAWCETRRNGSALLKVGKQGETGITEVGGGQSPMWSKDGSHLYFLRADNTGFAVCRFDGGQTSVIGHIKTIEDTDPCAVLSFDERSVVFVQEEERKSKVQVFSFETKSTSTLFEVPASVKHLSLSPDGSVLCYLIGNFEIPQGLFTFDLVTHEKKLICSYPGKGQPAWGY